MAFWGTLAIVTATMASSPEGLTLGICILSGGLTGYLPWRSPPVGAIR
jgi:hypothetical protein